MRLNVSDEVVIFDGTGREYTGIVKAADRKSLEIEIKSTRESQSGKSPILTLIQAITKKDKMDYIAEKATELGVSRIIPVTTMRTIPDWDDAKKAGVVERWRKIAQEAAKQCGRADIPEVSSIVSLEEAIQNCSRAPLKVHYCLMAALSDKAIRLKDALKGNSSKNVTIAIGPEGDFTPGEAEDALRAGFKIVSLGQRVLKSDTAGLAALSMINYEYES